MNNVNENVLTFEQKIDNLGGLCDVVFRGEAKKNFHQYSLTNEWIDIVSEKFHLLFLKIFERKLCKDVGKIEVISKNNDDRGNIKKYEIGFEFTFHGEFERSNLILKIEIDWVQERINRRLDLESISERDRRITDYKMRIELNGDGIFSLDLKLPEQSQIVNSLFGKCSDEKEKKLLFCWRGHDLKEWQNRMRISNDKAAELLDIGRSTYVNYLTQMVIPRSIALACLTLEIAEKNQSRNFFDEFLYDFKNIFSDFFGN